MPNNVLKSASSRGNIPISVLKKGIRFHKNKNTQQSSQDSILQVEQGSPAVFTVSDVFPIGGKICIRNILSPSDYYPLDGK